MDMGVSEYFSMIKDSIAGAKDRNPAGKLPVSVIDWGKMNSVEDSLTWFGHSAFLLSIDNKKILVDPMFGPVASPVSFAGSKRYSEDLLHLLDELPPIDAVFITHDHYDHLDYPSIQKLKGKASHFFVPYGVSTHLIRWGVEEDKITEFNWWDEAEFQGLTVALTPSKHFSGRGFFHRDTTLWGGWVLAYHGWTEPIERALAEGKKTNVNLIAPQIGETVLLTENLSVPVSTWWKKHLP
ncbi:hypothetical protein J2T17_007450 [Paenibacillus mucilaginosus]|uniref:MBL fold metallo-hydrolase n=1 Tax=Paenibacillus mucilaginosus TaxID=61624 RepID=UPI003D222686